MVTNLEVTETELLKAIKRIHVDSVLAEIWSVLEAEPSAYVIDPLSLIILEHAGYTIDFMTGHVCLSSDIR
jgi:hypothetical protein